jgi:hypothetical protein
MGDSLVIFNDILVAQMLPTGHGRLIGEQNLFNHIPHVPDSSSCHRRWRTTTEETAAGGYSGSIQSQVWPILVAFFDHLACML